MVCPLAGNGITLEGAVPSEQDSQPKPAKRARTSFTAEQLQVESLGGCGSRVQEEDAGGVPGSLYAYFFS